MKFQTRAIHSGMQTEGKNREIVPPISVSTIYQLDPEGRKEGDLHYTRLDNPNRRQLEILLADLEEGAEAAAFSSGVAAAAAVFQALDPGDHIILPEDIYAGNRKLVENIMLRWGLEADFITMNDPSDVEAAIRENTSLIWIETPSNPTMQITDIRSVCRNAADRKILTAVDNTWPTPVNQLPLQLGADLVVHSTTKYFGGHSDILGGAVIARESDDRFGRIRINQRLGGAVPSPHDCWLLSRSIRTLACRMKEHNRHAAIVAEYLTQEPAVEKVIYPGLESHPGHQVAKKQMMGFGGMVSFLIRGGSREAIEVVGRSKLINRATSLGGVESTWEHRRSSEGEGSRTPENLIRISVGLEHPDDLVDDIRASLKPLTD